MELTLIRILVVVFSIVVHETAHGRAAGFCGDDTAREQGRLTLNPIPHIDPFGSLILPLVLSLLGAFPFGWAKPVPIDPRRLRDPWNAQPKIAAAGPASNLLLAVIFAVVLGIVVSVVDIRPAAMGAGGLAADVGLFLARLAQVGIQVNVVLALFNLLPIPPLDGSWVVRRFLPLSALRRYDQLGRFGFYPVIGFLVLVHYTFVGDVVSAGLMAVINNFFAIANFVAGLF